MKKILGIFSIGIVSVMLFILCFSYNRSIEPYTYYQVYLDGNIVGTIESKTELENYINNEGKSIRKKVQEYTKIVDSIVNTNSIISSLTDVSLMNLSLEEKVKFIQSNSNNYGISDIKKEYLKTYIDKELYNVSSKELNQMQKYILANEIYTKSEKVYVPNGIDIKKTNTYNDKVLDVSSIYKKIIKEKSPTISGYKFTIKSESKEFNVYVTDKKVFEDAIDKIATIFIGSNEYNAYKNNAQSKITDTGTIIENVYLQEDVSYKQTNISIDENIYTDSTELSKYLLYGDSYEQKEVIVTSGDTISRVAYANEISVEEFLISNPEYTNRDNLLYEGKKVIISKINAQVNVIEETYNVNDIETNYSTVEQYDSSINRGSEIVTQEGENGVERVTQNIKRINGQITYIEPINKETIKPTVSRVITVGTKYVATVGSTSSWGWPTNSGYTLSSYYGYRLIGGRGEFHNGLDISGTGYGSQVYASNNGVVEERQYNSSYGNYILINHGNGYWSLYAHMSRFSSDISVGSTVARGQIIGYVGSTGRAFGPHLHYEIRKGCGKFSCITDPLQYYR